jgi:predicted dehydrogenase
VPVSRTIGIGIIGMGWMGIQHSRGYLQIGYRFPECPLRPRLLVCADALEARARDAQQLLGFERSTTDWAEVVRDPEVEVVNIAAPNACHLEMVRAAASHGKHILCEKPVGRNPAETREIVALAQQAGVLTFVGLNYRWAPLVQHARALIREGRLGRLTHYRGRFFAGYASNPHGVLSWRFRREEAGLGTLGDLMSHVIDMAHFLVGPIERVTATRATFVPQRPLPSPGGGTHFDVRTQGPLGEVTNEDYVGVLTEFADGARGTLEACRIIQGPQCQMAFEVNGTEGALSWDFERMNELRICLRGGGHDTAGFTLLLSGPEHPFHVRFNPGPGIGLSYEDLKTIEAFQFLNSIADSKQGEPGFAAIEHVAEVQQAIERSWESGGWSTVGLARDVVSH